jgi:hypothetical protein
MRNLRNMAVHGGVAPAGISSDEEFLALAAGIVQRLKRGKLVGGLRFRIDAHRSPAGVFAQLSPGPRSPELLRGSLTGFEDEVRAAWERC